MDHEAPIGETRRGFRHWKRLILAVPGLIIIGFVLSNLLLATPWARGWISGIIENRTKLETRLGGASWSPWGGILLLRLELLQPPALRTAIPDPILRVNTLQVSPVWRAWLRGRFDLHSMSLDHPQLTLPLELLSHLAQSPASVPPVAPSPATASIPPPEPAIPRSAPPPAVGASPPPPQLPAETVPKPPPRPTGWLHLKDASLSIVSVSLHDPLFQISGASGSLPIAGDPANSELKIDSISMSGHPVISRLAATLDWRFPILSLKPVDLQIGTCKFAIAGKIADLSGLPLQIEAKIPEQALPPLALPFNSQVCAESIAVNFDFRGLLLAPPSWQGNLVMETRAPLLRAAGHDAKFDRGSSVTMLRGGRLSCVDARLIGDELSLLGNASLIADGRIAAALRIVAPPANLEGIVRQAFPAVESPALTALGTPQRAAFDLEAFGTIRQVFVRLGKDGPVVNLNPDPNP